jgi:hypothetical protein
MTPFKKLLLATTFVALSTAVSAQLSLGLRGGINVANQTYKSESLSISPNTITGLTFAGIIELELAENFAIQPELVFVQKGFMFDLTDLFGNEEVSKTRLNHIEIPILAKYKFGGEKVGAYLATGPSFGYAISASTEYNGEKEKFEGDDWDNYNRFEVGFNLGGGIGIKIGSGQIFIDARYMLGLNNLIDDMDNEDVKARNKGISISLGYLANL